MRIKTADGFIQGGTLSADQVALMRAEIAATITDWKSEGLGPSHIFSDVTTWAAVETLCLSWWVSHVRMNGFRL